MVCVGICSSLKNKQIDVLMGFSGLWGIGELLFNVQSSHAFLMGYFEFTLSSIHPSTDILKMLHVIEVDSGSEFKGEVKKYFEDTDVRIKVAKPGRHRQISLVERRNQIIGKLF